MLRKLTLGLAVLLVAAGCAKTTPPQDVAADKAKLQTDALSWMDKFAAADSEALGNLYTEDAVLMPPNAPAVTGRAAIKSYLGAMSNEAKGAGLALKPGTVTGSDVSGDMGWLSGTYMIQDSTGATIDTGKYLSVHHRENGMWLYVRDTWNSDMPAAPPAPAKSASKKK